MAEDNTLMQRLVVSLEARMTQYERSLKKAQGDSKKAFAAVKKDGTDLEKSLEKNFSKTGTNFVSMLRGAAGLAGIGLSAAAIINLTSKWTDLTSQVNNAVGSISAGHDAMARLTEMARRTYSSLDQTVDGFTRNSIALTEMGYSTGQQLDLLEALNNALVVSNARGQQAESVMNAWTKAMALGELRGENLNTVIQSGGRLAKALADSMGVSTNELRKLGAQGRITSRDMFGVTRELAALRREADEMPATIQDGFVLLGNSLLQLVGQFDQATGASSFLAQEIITLADSIEQAARNWRDGDVPIIHFTNAVIGAGKELGFVQDAIEDTRTEIEKMDDAVFDARSAVIEFAAEIATLENVRDFAPHLPGEIEALVDKLLLGEATAEDTRAALVDLGTANPNFGPLIGQLSGLVGQMRTVTATADEMYSALNQAGGPTGEGAGRGGAGASRRRLLEGQDIAAGYVAEQQRLLSLSQQQLAIERAIAQIQKEVTAQGGIISREDAEALARQQVATAESRRSSAKAVKDEISAAQELIAELRQEQSALSMTESQKRTVEALRRAGKDATAGEIEEIIRLVDAVENERNAIERLKEAIETGKGLVKDFAGGLAADLLAGKDATEALNDAIGRLSARLMQMALDNAINALFSGITGMFGGGPQIYGNSVAYTPGVGFMRRAAGGLVTGPGSSTSDSIPALLSNGEYVVNARATARHRPLLEMLNSGLERFSSGGLAGRVANVPALSDKMEIRQKLNITLRDERGNEIPHTQKMGSDGSIDLDVIVAGSLSRAAQGGKLGAFESLYGLKRRGG